MEALGEYLNSLPVSDQAIFAAACGTSLSYLRKAVSKKHKVGMGLAIAIERESQRKVTVEQIRPDVDWDYLRGSPRPRKPVTLRA